MKFYEALNVCFGSVFGTFGSLLSRRGTKVIATDTKFKMVLIFGTLIAESLTSKVRYYSSL